MIDDFAYPTTESKLIALQLGAICINWAQIDHTLGTIVGSHIKVDPSRWDIATSIVDISRKCELIKALSFLNDIPADYARLEKTLNFLDNQLRPRRNRYVHDSYSFWTGENIRRSMKTQVVSVQSFKKELRTAAQAQVTSEELAIFNADLDTCAMFLTFTFMRLTIDPSKAKPGALEALMRTGEEYYVALETIIARYSAPKSAS